MGGTEKSKKEKRRESLHQMLKANPFLTDRELAEKLEVSIQTIRLDRMVLGIPELKERVKSVVKDIYGGVRSLSQKEIVGELKNIKLGEYAFSVMEVTEEMVLEKNKIARGHYLFAQANSLAAAVIDADVVLTGSVRLRFKEPVHMGDIVEAEAVVKLKRGFTYLVNVYSSVKGKLVLKGQFVMAAEQIKEGSN